MEAGTQIGNKATTEDMKEVDVVWADEQRQRLKISLLGVSVKPIEFRKVMYKLLDDWGGPGEIECRDVGPFRCLITFKSEEIRDDAMQDELLLSLFDEIRPHWEIFWSLLRRVWIEIMGFPIGLWCNENLEKIVKLWGKMVKIDDRTEESKSYSTARIIMDCFQWERIHEWVKLKIDDREFQVFVKEFGSEVYSVQSHPDLGSKSSLSVTEQASLEMGAELQEEVERSQAATTFTNLKICNVNDPVSDAIMMNKWENVFSFNPKGVNGDVNSDVAMGGARDELNYGEVPLRNGDDVEQLDFDPMTLEAQLANGCPWPMKDLGDPTNRMPMSSNTASDLGHGSESSMSCPFSTGAPNESEGIVVRETPTDCANEFGKFTQNRRREINALVDDIQSDRTPLKEGTVETEKGGHVVSDSEDVESDETLYLINEEARAKARISALSDENDNVLIGSSVRVTAVENLIEDREPYFEAGTSSWVGDTLPFDSGAFGEKEGVEFVEESATDDIDEEALLAEADESKKIWGRGASPLIAVTRRRSW
ncbi:hypothetical protein PIB30_049188 [Stylosanthes scabra]|uniref:DUF4283 domain-containing protein n=1 Tax=Stylosanthes scabra TaxID=79078 RepID=A0ABU6UG10_9FABA|nr:hypothetical protein [Stylosanthes scabra]